MGHVCQIIHAVSGPHDEIGWGKKSDHHIHISEKGRNFRFYIINISTSLITNLDLEDRQAIDPGNKTREGGLSSSTDTNKQEVTLQE